MAPTMLDLAVVMDQDWQTALTEFEERLGQRFTEIDQRFVTLEARLDERFAETRRHAQIPVEDVRDDLRLVIDGVTATREHLGRHDQRFDRLEQKVDRLDLKVVALDGGIRRVESSITPPIGRPGRRRR